MKYSIIIPCYNGLQYLPTCIDTILSQVNVNFELIISDDSSSDGTYDYLQTLQDSRVKVLSHKVRTSMAEHWEWALKQASGDWIIFVGQDDGLQPYFFDLADRLTSIAVKKGIKVIMSERAYFFWPGCEKVYGNRKVNYHAKRKFSVRHSKYRMVKTLLGCNNYFDLPQMYTTSIIHKDLINQVCLRQHNNFFVTHPQDANVAAIVSSVTKKYLFSYIPLGWIGTSAKSAGMAISSGDDQNLKDLKQDYLTTIKKSVYNYNKRIGDFAFGSCELYFWGALLESKQLQSRIMSKVLSSRLMTNIVLAVTFNEMSRELKKDKLKSTQFVRILSTNSVSIASIKRINSFLCFVERFVDFLAHVKRSSMRKIMEKKILDRSNKKHQIRYDSFEDMTMQKANEYILSLYEKII